MTDFYNTFFGGKVVDRDAPAGSRPSNAAWLLLPVIA